MTAPYFYTTIKKRSTVLPLSELLEDNAVWKALSAYTNPLQDTITPQLIQNKVGIKFTSLQGEKGHLMVYFWMCCIQK